MNIKPVKINCALLLFLSISTIYFAQDSTIKFVHQYAIQSTITECLNNQSLQGKNKFSLAFDIACGIVIKKRFIDLYPSLSVGKQNNRVSLLYNNKNLPTHYILNYWYLKSSFNLGLKLNSRKKISFTYSILYFNNGDVRYSGKNTNSTEQLFVSIPNAGLNYGIGLEYSTKINETSNTQFFYKIETLIKRNGFNTEPNNNYFYIDKPYNIQYQSHSISIGLRFEGLKKKNNIED